jgi:DNA-binding response OmpR family regulator
MRMTSRHILSEAGFSVVEAGDGEQALRLVWECQPDLIILDMLLPKWGANTCCKLSGKTRRQPAFR